MIESQQLKVNIEFTHDQLLAYQEVRAHSCREALLRCAEFPCEITG